MQTQMQWWILPHSIKWWNMNSISRDWLDHRENNIWKRAWFLKIEWCLSNFLFILSSPNRKSFAYCRPRDIWTSVWGCSIHIRKFGWYEATNTGSVIGYGILRIRQNITRWNLRMNERVGNRRGRLEGRSSSWWIRCCDTHRQNSYITLNRMSCYYRVWATYPDNFLFIIECRIEAIQRRYQHWKR